MQFEPRTVHNSNLISTGTVVDMGSLAPDSRGRSYTLDTLNISSIESRREHGHNDEDPTTNVESATWLFSDLLQSISIRDKDDIHLLVSKSNELVSLLRANPSLKHEIVIENVISKVQFMLYDQNSQLRCAAYRILRHSTAGQDGLQCLVRVKLLIFIIVTFSTPSPLLEKEEALKMVRHFMDIPDGANYLSIGIIKALVALVEHENEESQELSETISSEFHVPAPFSRLCIETICELASFKPDIVFHGGGLRLLITLIINASSDIAASCIIALLSLLDRPNARLFLRNGFDLDSLISVYSLFEDNDEGKTPSSKRYYNRALKISFLLSLFLKSWTGIICFSHNKFGALKLLLSNLRKKNNKLRSMILDLLLDILRIKALPWLENSSVGEAMSKFMSQITCSPEHQMTYEYSSIDSQSFEFSIVSHYQGLLSKVLFNCDVMPLLFDIINENRDEEITMKATYFLTHVVNLSVNLLPRDFYNTHIIDALVRPMTLNSISKIEVATKSQQISEPIAKKSEIKNIVKDITIESRLYMDDGSFKTLIANTKVLAVKEFDEWNWTYISQLCQGPLRNPKRFAEIQEKYPKFLKTILSFFRPFKYRFSNLPLHASTRFPKLKNPKKIILIGCQIFESLLSFEDGYKFLVANKIMPQIAETFAQVDPFSGIQSNDAILSRKRLENTLSIGYVKFIGVFSGCQNGIRILEQWQIFQITNNIVEASNWNDDNNHLIFNLFNNLDFTNDSPFTILLSKALNVSNWKVKVFLLDNVLPKLLKNEETERLCISNLVSLLYDEIEVVVEMAVDMLHNFYIVKNKLERIDLLIGYKPSIRILSDYESGRELLLNFCKTSIGFRFLHKSGFIESSFNKSIKDLQEFEYLNSIETSLRVLFYPYFSRTADVKTGHKNNLHHFFNYLLSTEEGFNYFNSRRSYVDDAIFRIQGICRRLDLLESYQEGHDHSGFNVLTTFDPEIFDDLMATEERTMVKLQYSSDTYLANSLNNLDDIAVESPGAPIRMSLAIPEFETTDDEEEFYLRKLKQYLWVMGEIASANYGIQILDPIYSSNLRSEHIVETIYQLFMKSANWQLRGLAFYQLGKIASTLEGVEMLDDLQWMSVDCVNGFQSLSLAYPKAMQNDDFFNVEILNPYKDASYFTLFGNSEMIAVNGQLDLEDEIVIETYEELDSKVLALINYLSSVLSRIERKAKKDLNRIKAEKPQIFGNCNLFLKVIRLIDKGKFSYRTRIFIFHLFNTSRVLESLTKRDRKNSNIRK